VLAFLRGMAAHSASVVRCSGLPFIVDWVRR
jgi:hypothetical protein